MIVIKLYRYGFILLLLFSIDSLIKREYITCLILGILAIAVLSFRLELTPEKLKLNLLYCLTRENDLNALRSCGASFGMTTIELESGTVLPFYSFVHSNRNKLNAFLYGHYKGDLGSNVAIFRKAYLKYGAEYFKTENSALVHFRNEGGTGVFNS